MDIRPDPLLQLPSIDAAFPFAIGTVSAEFVPLWHLAKRRACRREEGFQVCPLRFGGAHVLFSFLPARESRRAL